MRGRTVHPDPARAEAGYKLQVRPHRDGSQRRREDLADARDAGNKHHFGLTARDGVQRGLQAPRHEHAQVVWRPGRKEHDGVEQRQGNECNGVVQQLDCHVCLGTERHLQNGVSFMWFCQPLGLTISQHANGQTGDS